jgi:7,8-dihydro-6-hydroxymethylpterin-pyrophosphokinase
VRTLFERCLAVEDTFERVRDVRWGPRTLDIDVITYGDTVSDAEDLTLPHPRAAERAFVLVRGTTSGRTRNWPGMDRSPICWPARPVRDQP